MKKISMIAFVLFLCILCATNAIAKVSFTETVNEYGEKFCWFCPIFGTLFDAMNTIATEISKRMSQTFLALMGVALLFSIGFKTARMLTSLQAVDIMQYLTDMFRHLGRAIIGAAFLWMSLSVFTYIVSPVLTMSLSLSTSILEEGGFMARVTAASQEAGIRSANVCTTNEEAARRDNTYANAAPLMLQEEAALQAGNAPQEAFAPSVRAALMCMLKTVSASLIGGMAIGATFYAFGWWDLTFIFPNVLAVATGALILVGHLFIFVSVPFKYIDSMIRMAFVSALMPLWVVLWVFDATRGYTKKAWDMFLSTCAIFLCMSVVLILVIHLINAALPAEVAKNVVRYMMADQILNALAAIDMDGKNFLVTLIMCFTGYKMLGTATSLASSFIGGIPNLGVGDQMAKTSVSVAQGAKTAGIAAGMVGGRLAKAGLNKVGGAMGKPGLGDKVSSAVKASAPRAAAAVLTMGYSEAARFGAKKAVAAGKGMANAYKNRYANAPSPTLGKTGTSMGVDAGAMGLTGVSKFDTTENGVRTQRTQKSFRDAAGNKLTQTFDKNGTLRSEALERKDGSKMTKVYDEKGNISNEFMKNADGTHTDRAYKNGSITTTHRDANHQALSETVQKLDKDNNLVSQTITNKQDGSVQTSHFDKNGNITSETRKEADGSVNTKTYNNNQQVATETHRDKDGQGYDATHRYDADGNKYGTDFKLTNGAEQAVLHDKDGKITGVTQINQDGSGFDIQYKDGEAAKTTYYDKEGNVEKEVTHDLKETHTEMVEREVVHEKEGGSTSSGTESASKPETSADTGAASGSQTPADAGTRATATAAAPTNEQDISKLESKVEDAKNTAGEAKTIAGDADMKASTAMSVATSKKEDDKTKNKGEY